MISYSHTALIIFLCLIQYSIEQKELNGNFQECLVTSSLNMLQIDEDCFREPSYAIPTAEVKEIHLDMDIHRAFVFSKHNLILETKGFECKILIHRYQYSKDLLFNKYIQTSTQMVRLSRYECSLMVKEKECGKVGQKRKLKCTTDNQCSHVDEISDDFPFYFGTVVKDYYECSFHEKLVVAQELTTNIFHNTLQPCFAEDEYCYLEASTVIWEREAIRSCKLERLIELESVVTIASNYSTIFMANKDEYLFKLSKLETHCGLNFYLTTEGLYLALFEKNYKLREKYLSLPISKYSINHFMDKDISNLILAENDFKAFQTNQFVMDVTCSTLMNTIKMNLRNDDTFLTLNYLGKRNIMIYIKNEQPFLPICSNVSIVYIPDDVNNNCDKEIKITYKKNKDSKTLKYGYLRPNNIITQFSTKLDDCQNNEKAIIITTNKTENGTFFIRRYNNKIETKLFNSHVTEFRLNAANLMNIYNHHAYLTNGSDFYEQMNEYLSINEKENLNFNSIRNVIEDEKPNPFKTIGEGVTNLFKNIKKSIIFYFCSITFIAVLIVVVFIILLGNKRSESLIFSLGLKKRVTNKESNIALEDVV